MSAQTDSQRGSGMKKVVTFVLVGLFIGSAVHEFGMEAPVHDEAHAEAHADDASTGEHWSIVAFLPNAFIKNMQHAMGPSLYEGEEHVHVSHVFMTVLVFFLMLGLGLAARRRHMNTDEEGRFLPPQSWSALAFFDLIIETLLGTMEGLMPRKDALAALPLVASFAVFILFANLMGLIPGLLPPTDNLNTTMALAVVCFVAYNAWGVKKQGIVAYLKHFAGPVWWLAWFMFPVELVSHVARPLSLSIRLMGNMFGDHLVLGILLSFHLLILPLPVMVLGLIVCVVQTAVFTLLTIVYVALAVEEHEHDDHGHAEATAH